jgi:hypothetical protein
MGEIVNIGASDYVGRIWQFNEDEDAAMEYLPHADQVLYLRGMRKNMDFSTGVVGIRRAISYQGFKELLEINRRQGSNKPSYAPTKDELRACIERLVKAGLLERINLNTGSRIERMVFRLPLAHVGQRSISIKEPLHHTTGTPPAKILDVTGPREGVNPTSENQVNPIHQLVSKSDIKEYSENSEELSGSAQIDSLNLEKPKAVNQGVGYCPHQEILDLWAKHLPGKKGNNRNLWPKSDASKKLKARWREAAEIVHSSEPRMLYSNREEGLVWWGNFFEYISKKCKFLMSDGSLFFNLGWLVESDNFIKTLNGNFEVLK